MIKIVLKGILLTLCSVLIIIAGTFIISNITPVDVDKKIVELNSYCRTNGYNTNYGILVDFGKHTFKKRFFVVDLNNGDVLMKCLCSHGRGGESTIFRGEFSNVPGSYCSSLGHYKIGRERKMYKLPAMAFELDGLDKTNSNARSRAILLHKTFGPMSLGCVTIPLVRYNKVAKLLHSESGGVILWAYE